MTRQDHHDSTKMDKIINDGVVDQTPYIVPKNLLGGIWNKQPTAATWCPKPSLPLSTETAKLTAYWFPHLFSLYLARRFVRPWGVCGGRLFHGKLWPHRLGRARGGFSEGLFNSPLFGVPEVVIREGKGVPAQHCRRGIRQH